MSKQPAGRISAAKLKELRAAVAKDPDSALKHLRLGTALCQVGLTKEAEAECRRAVELAPDDPKAWVNLGGVLLARWDFAGCVEVNRKAIACDEDLKEAHYNCGLGHLYLGQAEEMVTCFRKVLKLDPDNPGGYYHLAVGLLALKQVEAARTCLTQACQLGYHPLPEFVRELENEERKQFGGPAAIVEVEPGKKDDSNHQS